MMKTENHRENFFKGITEMLTSFGEIDLKRMKSIIDNEILSRRKIDTEQRIITKPGIVHG